MGEHPARRRHRPLDVHLGHRDARLRPRTRQDLAVRTDHLGLAEEPHPAGTAGEVRRHQHHLVLRRPRPVVELEPLGLPVIGHAGRADRDARRPRRQARQDLRPVERESAGGLGEGLVVVDEHAEPPDRGVHRAELRTRGVDPGLTGWLVHLPVQAQHAVAADTRRGVVPQAGVGLAEPDADHHLPGQLRDRRDLGPVRVECRRQGGGVGIGDVVEISAECGIGQDEELNAVAARVLHERRDAGQVERQVPPETGRNGADPDRSHGLGLQAAAGLGAAAA